MISHPKKINFFFDSWLKLNLLLVFFIIIVGGLTRLTDSGLSITEWELFTGILPPLNDVSWNNYFNLYKEIPQYKLLNQNMSLSEFKIIFYWEYFHRILARLIGLFFLIPLIYFYLSKSIDKKKLNICFFIFVLILLQGFVGWYMVSSGLINVVTVSHYRLSLHLIFAFLIISSIYWIILNNKEENIKIFFSLKTHKIPFLVLILLIFIQISFGAFVSGLDAGRIYQTWPLMGQTFFPNDVTIINFNILLDLNNHSLVQFYHRILAYLICIYVVILSFYFFYKKVKKIYKPLLIILLILFIQILLGILTLVSGLNMYVASAHQISSVMLVFSSIYLYYSYIK
tara:strand:+ start:2763 stop:3788 length:1026 start_codon:yes stop_codon:yes gene_type:complete